jgi:transposase
MPNLTPLFRERMDDILALYTKPLPQGHEVHNFDETPKQLLSTPHGTRAQKPGKFRRLDHEYKREGTRNIFVAVAPFKGTRTVSVTLRRTTQDTADFLWNYCMEEHGDAVHIHLVLDNLNTHAESSLRAIFGEEKSARFFSRVTFHFTPFHASWLNMAELEINCLKTQGLKRRIATDTAMKETVAAIVKERNTRIARISWGFTKAKAREKFPALYIGN